MEKLTKIHKIYDDEYVLAERVISAIMSLIGERLTDREIQLLAYLCIKGDISNVTSRNEFFTRYNSTYNSMSNTICSLKKKDFITKKDGKITHKLPFNLHGKELKLIFHVI